MNDFVNSHLKTAEDRAWLFNLDELDARKSDAPARAKSAVANTRDVRYRKLRARLVNTNQLGDTYVVVVEAL